MVRDRESPRSRGLRGFRNADRRGFVRGAYDRQATTPETADRRAARRPAVWRRIRRRLKRVWFPNMRADMAAARDPVKRRGGGGGCGDDQGQGGYGLGRQGIALVERAICVSQKVRPEHRGGAAIAIRVSRTTSDMSKQCVGNRRKALHRDLVRLPDLLKKLDGCAVRKDNRLLTVDLRAHQQAEIRVREVHGDTMSLRVRMH